MSRPWHRSPLFYLGLFPLLFLLWAWWDSTRHLSGIHWKITIYASEEGRSLFMSGREHLTQHGGKITLHLTEPRNLESATINRDPVETIFTDNPTAEWLPLPERRETLLSETVAAPSVSLPHWILVLAYLIPWSLLLLWRSRRRRHLSGLKISA
jgi:hypothetical protein